MLPSRRLLTSRRRGECRYPERSNVTKVLASRFKSKLFMVLSHSPLPFDQRALTVRLHFESWVLKNTRQHLFNSPKGWPLNIPFDPSPSGQGAHHFSLCHIWQLVAWALGVGWGSRPLGAATRCPRRRRPFHFFLATWPFLAIRNVRVLGFTTDDDDETGLPPLNPLVLRTENRQIFIANFFFQKKFWRQFFLAILINRKQ